MANDLGAVLDAPEVSSADEVVEQVSEAQPEATEQRETTEQPEVKGDERVLPQWIRNLKATDPAGFKEAKGQFFGKRTLDEKLKDFDLDGIKGFLEEHGGRDGLTTVLGELKGKAEQYDGLLEKIEAGNREVLADIPPESLAKLAPAVAEEWSKVDPEGWGAAMSGIIASTIQANGVPMFLERMGMMLEFGKTEDAVKMLDQLKGWAGSFTEKAQAPRTTQAKQPDKLSEREQALAKRESEVFMEDLRRDVDGFREPLIMQELDSYFKRRPNDGDAKEMAIDRVRADVIKRMSADEDFRKARTALLARKDKEGALRLIKSRETVAIKEIAPKVGRAVFGGPPAGKVEEKKPAVGTQPKTDGAYMPISEPPDPKLIDKFRTTETMIMRGQFILKDGRKFALEG